MAKRTKHKFLLTVSAPSNCRTARLIPIIEKMMEIGIADAADSVESTEFGESTDDDAQIASLLESVNIVPYD